jgi:hypothetical protein
VLGLGIRDGDELLQLAAASTAGTMNRSDVRFN